MNPQLTITTEYFKQYRDKLGFSRQSEVSNFFGAKDITPTVDLHYIKILNVRLGDIVDKINGVVSEQIRHDDNDGVRIEMQIGFTGINDIKQHKVTEAKKVFQELNVRTVAIHFDLFNWQVAFIRLEEIDDNSMNWITRINLDDGLVYNINQNLFFGSLCDIPPMIGYSFEKYNS